MKTLIISAIVALSILTAQPAEAKGIFRKVLGAPFWIVGFTVTLVADVTVVPLCEGATHYIDAPSVNKKVW